MQYNDKIATIIVTYNGARWIEKCLVHLLNGSYPSTVIVVDNHSTDNTIAVLKPFMAEIVFIQNADNLGFGAANNIGLTKAIELGVDYVCLLNQDVYLDRKSVEILLQTAKAFPEYGILSPLQVNPTGAELDATFKKSLLRSVKPAPSAVFPSKNDTMMIEQPITVRFTNAASWFMPIEVVKRVGFFHRAFYHYGEDNHYCSRVQYFGYKVGVINGTAVMHDRQQRGKTEKDYLRGLKTVPLYTLLDIRKPFFVAYLLGLHKLQRFQKKLSKVAGDAYEAAYTEQRKWFFERVAEAKAIRRATKNPATK